MPGPTVMKYSAPTVASQEKIRARWMPVSTEGMAEGRNTRVTSWARLKVSMAPTSTSCRDAPRTPSQVLTTTGVKAAMAMNATLAVSPMPNHIEISGIQAKTAICFSASKEGLSSRSATRDRPSRVPRIRPAVTPIEKPARSRARLAARSPRSAAAGELLEGGGRHRLERRQDARIDGTGAAGDLPGREQHERQDGAAQRTAGGGGHAGIPSTRQRWSLASTDASRRSMTRPTSADHGHRHDHRVEPEHLPAPDQQVAEPFRGGQQLDGDQRQPGVGEAVADAGEDRRHGGRQHHPAQELAAVEAEHLRHLDIGGRHGAHAGEGVERDRHEGGLGDHQHLERLVDPDDQHQERYPAQGRDLGHGREQRPRIVLDRGREAHGEAERQACHGPQREALEHAKQADRGVMGDVAGLPHRDRGLPDQLGRRQDLLRQPPQPGEAGPQHQGRQRHDEPGRGCAEGTGEGAAGGSTLPQHRSRARQHQEPPTGLPLASSRGQ